MECRLIGVVTRECRYSHDEREHEEHEGYEREHEEHEGYEREHEEAKRHYDKNERAAVGFMASEGYSEYIKKHGYHFTDALAEHASKMMQNSNGQSHTWSASQVKKSMESLGWEIPSHVTSGDMAYTANMAYADFYPDPLKDEASCLKYAYMVAKDPDGYEGMIFSRWVADAIGKGVSIDWKKFI